MSRPLRLEFPGALFHITSRGNASQQIFLNDGDRIKFLSILSSSVERFNWLCHSYCLMGNHYHLLIETPEGNLSRGMKHINGVYTQWFNYKYQRVGHLFQGRFKSILVDKDNYLLELCRYIVLNPVRAGFVEKVSLWEWSSYKYIVQTNTPPQFLTVNWILSQFSSNINESVNIYRQFVEEGIDKENPLESVKGQFILGKEDFIKNIETIIEEKADIGEIPKVQRYCTRQPLEMIFTSNVLGEKKLIDEKIYEAYKAHRYTQSEIAKFLNLHYTTVSRAIKRTEEKM